MVRYTSDRESVEGFTESFEAWEIAPFIFKVGLFNDLDGQVLIEPYSIVKERTATNDITRQGFGDITLRF